MVIENINDDFFEKKVDLFNLYLKITLPLFPNISFKEYNDFLIDFKEKQNENVAYLHNDNYNKKLLEHFFNVQLTYKNKYQTIISSSIFNSGCYDDRINYIDKLNKISLKELNDVYLQEDLKQSTIDLFVLIVNDLNKFLIENNTINDENFLDYILDLSSYVNLIEKFFHVIEKEDLKQEFIGNQTFPLISNIQKIKTDLNKSNQKNFNDKIAIFLANIFDFYTLSKNEGYIIHDNKDTLNFVYNLYNKCFDIICPNTKVDIDISSKKIAYVEDEINLFKKHFDDFLISNSLIKTNYNDISQLGKHLIISKIYKKMLSFYFIDNITDNKLGSNELIKTIEKNGFLNNDNIFDVYTHWIDGIYYKDTSSSIYSPFSYSSNEFQNGYMVKKTVINTNHHKSQLYKIKLDYMLKENENLTYILNNLIIKKDTIEEYANNKSLNIKTLYESDMYLAHDLLIRYGDLNLYHYHNKDEMIYANSEDLINMFYLSALHFISIQNKALTENQLHFYNFLMINHFSSLSYPNLNSMFQDLMYSYYKSISIDMKNGFFNLKHTLQFHTKFVLDFTSVSFLSKIEDENIKNFITNEIKESDTKNINYNELLDKFIHDVELAYLKEDKIILYRNQSPDLRYRIESLKVLKNNFNNEVIFFLKKDNPITKQLYLLADKFDFYNEVDVIPKYENQIQQIEFDKNNLISPLRIIYNFGYFSIKNNNFLFCDYIKQNPKNLKNLSNYIDKLYKGLNKDNNDYYKTTSIDEFTLVLLTNLIKAHKDENNVENKKFIKDTIVTLIMQDNKYDTQFVLSFINDIHNSLILDKTVSNEFNPFKATNDIVIKELENIKNEFGTILNIKTKSQKIKL